MPDIVLKDRNGTSIQYPGVDYIKVNKAGGGTQSYASCDPDTLKAENLVKGVTIGDVVGTLEVPQILEDVPVELDFSSGDNMEFAAPDGYAVKSAVVQKPSTLVPANILKDVDIAGIVGTYGGGGGGGPRPYLFCRVAGGIVHNYSKTGTYNHTATTDIPAGSIVQSALGIYRQTFVSMSTDYTNYSCVDNVLVNLATIEKTDEKITVSFTRTVSASYKWFSVYAGVDVVFSLPGFYLDEDNVMYADGSAVEFPSKVFHMAEVTKADLSGGVFTNVPEYAFCTNNNTGMTEILLPSTVTEIGACAFKGIAGVIDFSRHTAVPTLSSTDAFTAATGLEIRVPSALYDEWKAATNWSTLASYIVAV